MKARKAFGFVLMLIMPFGFDSCRKLLQVPAPQDQLVAATVYSNDEDAEAALTGLYVQLMLNSRTVMNGGLSLYGGLSSDELMNTAPSIFIDPFREDQLSPGNPYVAYLWSTAYNMIFTANSLLDGLKASKGVSAGVKTELRGEAEVVRALLYFYLVNIYGGVPLVTTSNFLANSTLPRDSIAGIYAQIEADLEDAQQVLPVAYATNAGFPSARTRPNRMAAAALLARVSLYRGEWLNAVTAADAVIGSGMYLLEPSLDTVYLADSREAIWQLQPVNITVTTEEAAIFVPRSPVRPAFVLTPEWLGAVEPGDLRRQHWVDSVSSFGISYFYPYKYKLTTVSAVDTEYDMVMRLAELYLIRAEAEVQLGDLPGAAADLNMVRARAGLPPTAAVDGPGLLAAILHERQIELVAEMGHRWLDLKRLNLAGSVLANEKPGWVDDDELYPIPATELSKNSALVQNPGYQ